MCLVLVILKQWHTEVATKLYFYEQEKEYNRIILMISITDPHLFLVSLCSSFNSYQDELL